MATRDVIKSTIRNHLLNNNGQLYCQALLGCGFVANTVPNDIPNHKGLEELPTSDASNGGIVCGSALMGRRPIYVVRYQGFLWYNAVSIVNYAAKSKEMWKEPCPVFVRGLAMEGSIGPVASNCHHSIIAHMPNISVHVPMTGQEWTDCWNEYMSNDDPMFCSEPRLSYDIEGDLPEIINHNNPDVTIIAIGSSRIETQDLISDYNINIAKCVKISPKIQLSDKAKQSIQNSKLVLVIDSDYTKCSISEHICCDIMTKYNGVKAYPLGLKEKSAGFAPKTDNKTPNKQQILNRIKELV